MNNNEEEIRGDWQKIYVRALVNSGISYNDAMIAMSLTCDQREKAYTEGYTKGYNDGYERAEHNQLIS